MTSNTSRLRPPTSMGSGWAYNLYFKRTLWSALPYAVAFGTLPAVVTLALPDPEWPAPWTFLAGALLSIGAHLLNALPDLADDASTGVHALPHQLGELLVCTEPLTASLE